MRINVEVKRSLQVGDFFTLEGQGQRLYQLVESKDPDCMTPFMVVHVQRGEVVGRSTAPTLALENAGVKPNQVSVYGSAVSFSRD